MHDACGVAYADFLNTPDSDRAAKLNLERALNQALQTKNERDHSPVLLLLDNFNYCKGECEKLMTKVASTKRFRLDNNREANLENTVILITSDLTQEGLRLMPEDDKSTALSRILNIVHSVWGEQSLWNDRAHLVPFLPYTDQELIRILELTIEEVKDEIRQDIDEVLDLRKEEMNLNIGSTVRWVGRFKFPEQEKVKLIDAVHSEVAKQNCRAFEKIKGKLIAASRRPEAIESRFLRFKPYVRSPGSSWRVLGYLYQAMRSEDVQYTQNIVIKTVSDSRMVIMDVEDIDEETAQTEL